VSNSAPHHNQTVDILVTTGPGAQLTVTAHYKTKNTVKTGTADASGHGSVAFDISTATYGYTVNVGVTAVAGGRTASCSTSFTPAAA
jgi:hypothetical protein